VAVTESTDGGPQSKQSPPPPAKPQGPRHELPLEIPTPDPELRQYVEKRSKPSAPRQDA